MVQSTCNPAISILKQLILSFLPKQSRHLNLVSAGGLKLDMPMVALVLLSSMEMIQTPL